MTVFPTSPGSVRADAPVPRGAQDRALMEISVLLFNNQPPSQGVNPLGGHGLVRDTLDQVME